MRFATQLALEEMMDHRWDESTWQDRASRAENDRFGTSRIERDLDVERRDRLCLADRIHRVNQSPWAIGNAWYDQRDLYTRNAEIDARGYGCGPRVHPEEGSYAYHREFHPNLNPVQGSSASLYEKEAWPWLVYKGPEEDPYFAHLADEHEHPRRRVWQRLRAFVARALHIGRRSAIESRSDERIRADAADALWYRSDLDASDIDVNVKAGTVTLEGTVPSRRSKRIATEVARGVRGVRYVHNRLRVRRDDLGGADVAFAM
jgi:hypothetical protein